MSPAGTGCAADHGPVDVSGGESARLEIRRDQQHPVEAAAGHPAPGGVQRAHLGDDVTAQRGVTATDHYDRGTHRLAECEQVAGHPRCVNSTAASSGRLRVLVRMKHVDPGSASPARIFIGFEDGHDADVVHCLRSGRVVVQDGDPPAGSDVAGPDPFSGAGFSTQRRCGGDGFLRLQWLTTGAASTWSRCPASISLAFLNKPVKPNRSAPISAATPSEYRPALPPTVLLK